MFAQVFSETVRRTNLTHIYLIFLTIKYRALKIQIWPFTHGQTPIDPTKDFKQKFIIIIMKNF